MTRTRIRRLWTLSLALALGVLPVAAQAQVTGDDLGFDLVGHVEHGKGKPQIILRPTVNLSGVRFDCTRSDGQKVALNAGSVRAGGEKRTVVPQGKGVFQYACLVSGKAGKAAFAGFQLDFEVKVGAPPRIAVRPDDVDFDKRQITVRLSEPAARIELDVQGDDGVQIDKIDQEFHGEAPGTALVVRWQQTDKQAVGRFSLKAYDAAGFWSGIESVTFVDIPHDDVVFESGKWDIRPSEEGKLLAPLGEILGQLRKVEGLIPVQLYIGGYTDTVGSPADNVELSRKRAQAIAQWFVKKGLNCPIHAQGFGEGVLVVATPDDTDEPRNRRAAYVLATQPPPANRGFPSRNWTRLK